MKLNKMILTSVLALSINSCGKDDEKSSGGNKNKGKVDTTDFKNTASESEFNTKGDEVFDIYSSSESKFSSVNGSTFSSLGLKPMNGTNLDETNNSSPFESMGGSQFLGIMTVFNAGFQDCDSAISGIKQIYELSKSNLENALEGLDNGIYQQFPGDPTQLKKVEDPDAAIAYEFSSPAIEGVKISGSMTGSASETMIVITNNIDFYMDYGKFASSSPQGERLENFDYIMSSKTQTKIEADLSQKAIDFSTDANTSFKSESQSLDQTMQIEMLTSVQGGDLPSIEFDMKFTIEGQSNNMNMKIEMIDTNSVKFTGGWTGGESSNSNYSMTLSKDANGQCGLSK